MSLLEFVQPLHNSHFQVSSFLLAWLFHSLCSHYVSIMCCWEIVMQPNHSLMKQHFESNLV